MTDVPTAYARALTGMIDRTVECFELLDEIRALEAQLTECHARTTLGGVPPGYRPWGNVKLPPPPSAESGRFDGS